MQRRLTRRNEHEAIRKLKSASPLIGGKTGVLLRGYLRQEKKLNNEGPRPYWDNWDYAIWKRMKNK